ncbi:MAG: PTS system mannose/fructose/sorbose family transporter subunit IID [Collinsella sp.]
MLGASIYNYESQCAPAVMFATEPALRKIYAGDEEGYRRSLLSTYRYYNATPQVSGLLLGAGLALEDKGHNDAIDAVQDLKIGLMGSLSGVGDTIFAILIPTIFGSIAAYMGQAGNPVGVLLWLAVAIAIFVWKLFDWRIGYKFGDKLFTTLAEKMSVFTESTSALGMMVVGALIPTVIKVSCGLTFTMGEVTLDVQTGILDSVMVGMLPCNSHSIVTPSSSARSASTRLSSASSSSRGCARLSAFLLPSLGLRPRRVGIIIASHYGLAAGLGDTLKAIIGPGHDIRVVCAFTDETRSRRSSPAHSRHRRMTRPSFSHRHPSGAA